MYKAKLQELCQTRKWDLPVYEAKKEGLDHNPLFLATVTVTSIVFHSSTAFKSVKAAHNDVARLAYLHFTDQPPQSSASTEDRNRASDQINVNTVPAQHDEKTKGVQHLYKNHLQMYAQKNKLALPVYSCEQIGPSHASQFKCTVTIGGQSFDSEEYCLKLNEAEHAAAKAALLKLSPQLTEEVEFGYKNLLQEFTHKEGNALPSYKTIRSGEGHAPTFISTVEVNGKEFTGQPGKTKKQAEMSAAKVAFMALNQQCSPIPSAPPVAPAFQGQRPPPSSSSSLRSDLTAYLQRSLQPQMLAPEDVKDADMLVPKEVKDADIAGVDDHVPKAESPRPEEDSLAVNTSSDCQYAFALPKPNSTLPKLPSTLTLSEHNVTLPKLSPNAYGGSTVIIHPRGVKMTYPPGSIELPMSNDQWVAVQIKGESQQQ